MLRDAAVARVKQLLGFKKNLDPEILQAMIEIQEDLERSSELPFFLKKMYAEDYATFPAMEAIEVPEDFIREDDLDQMSLKDIRGEKAFPISKDIEGYLRVRWPQHRGLGPPERYARVYREFHFYPVPDYIYLIQGAYYAKDTSLSSGNIENKWLKELPFILVARAGMLLGSGLRDKEGIAILSAMNEIMTEKLHRMTAADDQAGARPVVGGDED